MIKLSDLTYSDSVHHGPWDRVKLANVTAFRAAIDPSLRRLAGKILRGCGDIPAQGAAVIARWIRKNFQYLQEAPGVELLQGPYTTLYTGVVDCDDAAILFVALTRAAGMRTFFVGVGPGGSEDLEHAVGYSVDIDKWFELVDDRNYTAGSEPGIFFGLPSGYYGVYYTNEPGIPQGYYTSIGNKFTKTTGKTMNCDTPGCMGETKKPAPGAGDQAAQDREDYIPSLIDAASNIASALIGATLGDPEQHHHYEVSDSVDYAPQEGFPWFPLVALSGAGVLVYVFLKG